MYVKAQIIHTQKKGVLILEGVDLARHEMMQKARKYAQMSAGLHLDATSAHGIIRHSRTTRASKFHSFL